MFYIFASISWKYTLIVLNYSTLIRLLKYHSKFLGLSYNIQAKRSSMHILALEGIKRQHPIRMRICRFTLFPGMQSAIHKLYVQVRKKWHTFLKKCIKLLQLVYVVLCTLCMCMYSIYRYTFQFSCYWNGINSFDASWM